MVGGYALNSTTSSLDFALAVYGPSGTPDTAFGGGSLSFGPAGTVTTDFGYGNATVSALAIDPSTDEIVVAGYAYNGTAGCDDMALARYQVNGNLDTSFGAGSGSFGPAGTVTTDFGSEAQASALAIDSSGRYVVGGFALNTALGNNDFALARYSAAGLLDNSFGAGSGSFGPAGTVTTDFGGGDAQVTALAVNASGQYVVADFAYNGTTTYKNFALARYNATGSLDSTFGAGSGSFGPAGTVTTAIGLGDAQANTLTINASTQQLVAAGYAFNATSGGADFAFARYNPTGILDTTFGNPGGTFGPAGTATLDFGSGRYAQIDALGTDPNGNELVTGYAFNGTTYANNLALARLTSSGAPDTTFGAGSGSFGPPGSVTWASNQTAPESSSSGPGQRPSTSPPPGSPTPGPVPPTPPMNVIAFEMNLFVLEYLLGFVHPVLTVPPTPAPGAPVGNVDAAVLSQLLDPSRTEPFVSNNLGIGSRAIAEGGSLLPSARSVGLPMPARAHPIDSGSGQDDNGQELDEPTEDAPQEALQPDDAAADLSKADGKASEESLSVSGHKDQ